jgi:hypothetical protein
VSARPRSPAWSLGVDLRTDAIARRSILAGERYRCEEGPVATFHDGNESKALIWPYSARSAPPQRFQLLLARKMQSTYAPSNLRRRLEQSAMRSVVDISIEGVTERRRDALAAELRQQLQQAIPEVLVERAKSNPATMDMGAVLSVILTSATAAAAVRGITNWLQKRNDVHLSIINKSNHVEARGLTSKDAVRIMEIIAVK